MYALVDNSTDGIDNLDKLKNFVYVDTLVNSMTIDDEGSASVVLNGLDIVLVEPTYPTKVSDVTFNWWLDTTEGLAVTCLLSAIACIFLLSMCLCCCWKCCGDRIGAWFKKCCKRKKKKLELVDERTSGWEMRSNDVGPSERPQMDTTPEEVVETSPVVPKPQTVPPGGNYTLGGVFDYRYAGRPHPSGPQHLKQKEMPPLILPPTPTSSKSAPKKEGESSQSLQPLLKKASPMLHRQPGRVSPEVGGIENSSSSTVDESKYDGNVYDKVTGKTYNFNTESGESSWDPPSRRLPPHGAHNFDV
uniref:Uncharacterized protein LOC102808265 n=1 Tax=Saccoglossus kowalevskii TaxID=10224 RepID=A0ABM0MBN4_SACKO|nr:PREDICTED: uncharacterized protein LOC102808265 [Saccoglossus kowalevskii]